jgi:hypothetical protein
MLKIICKKQKRNLVSLWDSLINSIQFNCQQHGVCTEAQHSRCKKKIRLGQGPKPHCLKKSFSKLFYLVSNPLPPAWHTTALTPSQHRLIYFKKLFAISKCIDCCDTLTICCLTNLLKIVRAHSQFC